MAVSERAIYDAIDAIAGVAGVEMDPVSLAEDMSLLAEAWDDEAEFAAAALATARALAQVAAGDVTPARLKHGFEGWESYHYQHRRAQGQRADMRLVFRRAADGILVLGFGHRNVPGDIYERLGSSSRG